MAQLGKTYYWGEKAKHVPEESGVYALYDKDRNLIYIGESNNLRKDFTNYLETDFSGDLCKRETRYYEREVTPNQEERAKELLSEYQQSHGELPKCNTHSQSTETEVPWEQGFHFYQDIGKPLHEIALNLDDLRAKISAVSYASLEFHQNRGDFSKWVRTVLNEIQLADSVQKIDETGERLKIELLNALGAPSSAYCPRCGTANRPTKTWNMAGRPNKNGERLQLTIGHYRCGKCSKSFRKVLAKKKMVIS
ncbi:MAG: GIY-YIG nuclease family protein [Candidatus Bathyarchaeota archaeon]|nr:MAG: GIY-YIG nuclease family protein [Candidatus Bathyarchaeota archaeon]